MSTLYIIGNGFDRAHGLPTDYKENLRDILIYDNKDLFEFIDTMFFENEVDFWSEFESRVGVVNENFVIKLSEHSTDVLQNFYTYNSDPFIGSYDISHELYGAHDIEVDNAIASLESNRPSFEEIYPFLDKFIYVRDFLASGMDSMIEAANEGLDTIVKVGTFEEESYFISFNYTETLEKLYDITESRILHIHGIEEKIWGNDSKFVNNTLDLEIDNTNYEMGDNTGITDYDNETGEGISYPYNLPCFYESCKFSDEVMDEYSEQVNGQFSEMNSSLIKNLEISVLDTFISMIGNICKIVILGHSLGEVDKEYFELLNKKHPQAIWLASFYREDDIIFENVKLLSFADKIKLTQFNELF